MLNILFQNENFIIIDKPASIVVNDALTQKENITVAQEVRTQFASDLDKFSSNEEFFSRAGIVHRLDKDTSGILIIAKNPDAFYMMQEVFSNRLIEKRYIALVYRKIKDLKINDQFEIEAPIKRNPKNREKFSVNIEGKEATTIFKLLGIYKDENDDYYSLLECEPKTGRTHQIRVHLTALNHPVVGDKLYSGKRMHKKNIDAFPRQFLHASYVKFADPMSDNVIEVKSSLPKDLMIVLDSLKEAL